MGFAPTLSFYGFKVSLAAQCNLVAVVVVVVAVVRVGVTQFTPLNP